MKHFTVLRLSDIIWISIPVLIFKGSIISNIMQHIGWKYIKLVLQQTGVWSEMEFEDNLRLDRQSPQQWVGVSTVSEKKSAGNMFKCFQMIRQYW